MITMLKYKPLIAAPLLALTVALTGCGTIEATSPGKTALAQWESEMASASESPSSPPAEPSATPKAAQSTAKTGASTAKPAPTVTVTATATATATVTAAPPRQYATPTVAADWRTARQDVNLRTGPGNAYQVAGKLRAGQQVTVLATDRGWVQTSAGGWAYEGYLSR